ncbi:hypothetical protein SAMN05428949_2430 [Chitinophaga sp. YR627]|uniref:hypothetical protein n=1 Tax=Chitinophaga sp. YR627 TaxID=1881041 RepID=UPI0008E02893|nr:hypothetical protein [Chitinophaga sp. YR627]SFN32555.1 hypothetical protein SAMN05428949_2430 [Chitinophaga sp. YR627]
MKKIVSLATLCTMLILNAYAQDSIPVSRNKYIQFDAGIGYLRTNMSSVNASLKPLGYHAIRDNYTTASFSTAYFYNRFLFRGEASLILPHSINQPDNMKTTFGGYSVAAGIGYVVMQTPRSRLYPYVAIQGFSTRLKFTDRTPVKDMNELISTSRRNSSIQFSNASIDAGIQFERMITLKNNQWDCPQNNKYMTIGFRLGYNWSPGTVKARYNGALITGAPEYNFQGPYLKVMIGLGKKIRNMKWN